MAEAVVTITPGKSSETVDTQEVETPKLEDMPKFSISVLAFTKEAQLQNGLRHDNYQKYRRYCSNRLRTLRKHVGFSHRTRGRVAPGKTKSIRGKPHKGGHHVYSAKKLEPNFTNPQYPFLALVNAERAWAYAMQLKQDAESSNNPRFRIHFLKRLRKAVFWSGQLKELATVRGDERTTLESQAYHSWLAGSAAMESDRWENALEYFMQTQTIYEQLVHVSSVVEQDLFMRRVQEVSTQIEFIRYKIDLNHGKGSSAGLITQLGATGLGSLQSKLEGVLQEERIKNSASLSRVEWCGHNIPIDNDKVRMVLLSARDTSARLDLLAAKTDPESEDFETIYFDLMSRYDDAQQLVEKDISSVSKVTLKADEIKLQMELLRSYIKSSRLDHTLRKNTAMIRIYAARWLSQQRGFGMGVTNTKVRSVRAIDVVKLHDTLLQNITDAKALPGSAKDFDFQKKFEFKYGFFSAARCYYIGEALLCQKRFAEAYAVYQKALQLRKELKYKFGSATDEADAKLLQQLEQDLECGRCRCLAKAVLQKQQQAAADASQQHAKFLASSSVLDRRNEFQKVSERGGRFPFSITTVPPQADAVAFKPLFFDLVRDDIVAPPTAHLKFATSFDTDGATATVTTSASTETLANITGSNDTHLNLAGGDDSDSDFESVEGSDDSDEDSDSDSDEKSNANTNVGNATGFLGTAKKWFGRS